MDQQRRAYKRGKLSDDQIANLESIKGWQWTPPDPDTSYYWLAINGASASASPMAMPGTVEVIPTPHNLIGYRTREACLERQKSLLTAPIEAIRSYMDVELHSALDRGEVMVITSANPVPPTEGATAWLYDRLEGEKQ